MFAAHGRYHFAITDQVLFIQAYGPWNSEAARAFDAAIRDLVSHHLKGRCWGMIAELHGEGIYTPESLPILSELHRWRIANGLRRLAIVTSAEAPTSQAITRSQFNQIYAQAGVGPSPDDDCQQRYFTSTAEAWQWLRQEGLVH